MNFIFLKYSATFKYLKTYTNDIKEEMRIENLGEKKTTYVLKVIMDYKMVLEDNILDKIHMDTAM